MLVAFDGMDKELLEKWDVEEVVQEEYGSIDNTSGMFGIWTTELFTSLITGENYGVHGVRGLGRWSNDNLEDFEKFLEKYWFFRKFNGVRKKFYGLLGFNHRGYTKQDYETETLFEEIPNSKSIDVPGYDLLISKGGKHLKGLGLDAAVHQQNWVHEKKKEDLFDAIEKDYDFLMAHFHKVDHFHHWFWEVGEEEPVKEAYEKFDEFAKEIKERAAPHFDYIIFMSDHGLPEDPGHNENAFYSCNKELFGDETPKITDFHDRILEIVQPKEGKTRELDEETGLSKDQEEKVKNKLEDIGYI